MRILHTADWRQFFHEYDSIYEHQQFLNWLVNTTRSLVVNEGKQIILSTYYGNFHNLLEKKMSPDFFRVEIFGVGIIWKR